MIEFIVKYYVLGVLVIIADGIGMLIYGCLKKRDMFCDESINILNESSKGTNIWEYVWSVTIWPYKLVETLLYTKKWINKFPKKK